MCELHELVDKVPMDGAAGLEVVDDHHEPCERPCNGLVLGKSGAPCVSKFLSPSLHRAGERSGYPVSFARMPGGGYASHMRQVRILKETCTLGEVNEHHLKLLRRVRVTCGEHECLKHGVGARVRATRHQDVRSSGVEVEGPGGDGRTGRNWFTYPQRNSE